MDKLAFESRLAVLLQSIGFALWQLQVLENAAAGYVLVRLRDARGVGAERGAQLTKEAESIPLGRLLRELANEGVVPPELSTRLSDVLEERNWLVHRSRRENQGILSDEIAYARLLARLELLADDALGLSTELAGHMEAFVVSSGVSRDYIDREAERLSRAWGLLD